MFVIVLQSKTTKPIIIYNLWMMSIKIKMSYIFKTCDNVWLSNKISVVKRVYVYIRVWYIRVPLWHCVLYTSWTLTTSNHSVSSLTNDEFSYSVIKFVSPLPPRAIVPLVTRCPFLNVIFLPQFLPLPWFFNLIVIFALNGQSSCLSNSPRIRRTNTDRFSEARTLRQSL